MSDPSFQDDVANADVRGNRRFFTSPKLVCMSSHPEPLDVSNEKKQSEFVDQLLSRQDQVLDQLDELNEQIEQILQLYNRNRQDVDGADPIAA